MRSEPIRFRPWGLKQSKAIFSEKRIVIFAAGIQSGKSTTGAVRIKQAMHRYTSKDDNFIVTAPTYKIMQQATLPAFMKYMEGYGRYSKVDAVFEMYNGGTCYFRTSTDPDSVVGITNVRSIWADECGMYPLYFHENLQARASFKQAPICYTTSPYSLNWLYSDYIRPITRGAKLEHVDLIQCTSAENPFFPKDEYELKRKTMDPRRFNQIYGGEFYKQDGLVYSCFEEDAHSIDPFILPPGTRFFAGVDWGFTNPAVILVIAVTPDWGMFAVAEWYQTQKTISEMVTIAKTMQSHWNIERFYCDPSAPANILDFNRNGLTAVEADNDIRAGIDSVYEEIKGGNFRVFAGKCPHLIDEISIYHYPQEKDILPDKDIKELLPVKQNEHCMDAMRYCIHMLKKTRPHNQRIPVVGGTKIVHNNNQEINRLLKKKVDYNW